jgi:hypothetical protein
VGAEVDADRSGSPGGLNSTVSRGKRRKMLRTDRYTPLILLS